MWAASIVVFVVYVRACFLVGDYVVSLWNEEERVRLGWVTINVEVVDEWHFVSLQYPVTLSVHVTHVISGKLCHFYRMYCLFKPTFDNLPLTHTEFQFSRHSCMLLTWKRELQHLCDDKAVLLLSLNGILCNCVRYHMFSVTSLVTVSQCKAARYGELHSLPLIEPCGDKQCFYCLWIYGISCAARACCLSTSYVTYFKPRVSSSSHFHYLFWLTISFSIWCFLRSLGPKVQWERSDTAF